MSRRGGAQGGADWRQLFARHVVRLGAEDGLLTMQSFFHVVRHSARVSPKMLSDEDLMQLFCAIDADGPCPRACAPRPPPATGPLPSRPSQRTLGSGLSLSPAPSLPALALGFALASPRSSPDSGSVDVEEFCAFLSLRAGALSDFRTKKQTRPATATPSAAAARPRSADSTRSAPSRMGAEPGPGWMHSRYAPLRTLCACRAPPSAAHGELSRHTVRQPAPALSTPGARGTRSS